MAVVVADDKYKKKGPADQILVDMKRRAAFIAKCARESKKITDSPALTARILKQYTKLNALCGLGATNVSSVPTWNLALASGVGLVPTTGAKDAVVYSTQTEAQFTAAHSTAKDAFDASGYVGKLVFTVPTPV
jgi:hypothetical protein